MSCVVQEIPVFDLGRQRYGAALQLMRRLHFEVAQGLRSPLILVVEHDPVVTMGKRKLTQDLHFDPKQGLAQAGVDYFEIDRGGSATAHEPGQLVVYPLLSLKSFDNSVRRFVHFLEEVLVQTCARYGVEGARDEEHPGVWCGSEKVAALGVRIEDHISRHGLAFNIENDLSTFRWITPCGIQQRSVTNLERQLSGQVGAQFKGKPGQLFADAKEVLFQEWERLYPSYTGTEPGAVAFVWSKEVPIRVPLGEPSGSLNDLTQS